MGTSAAITVSETLDRTVCLELCNAQSAGLEHGAGTVDLTLPTYLLTYSKERSSSSEANRFAASQEIPRILWNPKVHYRIHKCPPPVAILGQLDQVNAPTTHCLKIHLNVILPSTPGSPKWSLSLRVPHQNPV